MLLVRNFSPSTRARAVAIAMSLGGAGLLAGAAYAQGRTAWSYAPTSAAVAWSQAAPGARIEPNSADKRPLVQLGLGAMSYFSYQDALIDQMLQNSWNRFEAKVDGERRGIDWLTANGFVDPRTGAIKLSPAGGVRLGFIRSASKVAPAGYFDSEWIIDWRGEGDVVISSGDRDYTVKRVGRNRLEVSFARDHNKPVMVSVKSVTGAPVHTVRAYEKRNAARLETGEAFHPDFLERIRPYKVLRPMDWNRVNGSTVVRTNGLASPNDRYWGTSQGDDGFRVGVPIEAQVGLAVQSNAALWVSAPPMLGAPTWFAGLDFKSDPAGTPNRRTVGDKWRDVARRNAGEILGSNEYLTYARRLVAALDAADYPRNRIIYVECGNEIWNWAGGFAKATGFFFGLGDHLSARSKAANHRTAYGYMSAKMAAAMERAVAETGKPREWAVIIGTQSVNPNQTVGALAGLDLWLAEQDDPNAKQRLAPHFGLATTNYYRGVFQHDRRSNFYGEPDAGKYYDRLVREIEADPAGLSRRIADWFIRHPDGHTIPAIMGHVRKQSALIEEWGGFYAGNYEGGSHDSAPRSSPQAVKDFAFRWRASYEHARVLHVLADRFYREFPNAMLSNYVSQGETRPDRPWIEDQPGEVTPVTEKWRSIGLTPR